MNMHLKTNTLFLLLSIAGGALNAQTVNWANDIAPILYEHCVKCHRSGGIGNFSLLDYASAFTMRDEIADAVINRRMPPWKPDPAYRHYTGENFLSGNEIALVEQWVSANAPSGNLSEAPPPPVFPTGSEIGVPDMILQTPVYTMTATQDEYRCFVIPSQLAETVYLRGLEIIPGNHQAVHHVLIYEDVSGQGKLLDQQTPEAGYVSFGGPGFNNARLVGAWVPGSRTQLLPENMGVKLTGGADLIVQVHFPASATGMTDQSTLNMFFTATNQNIREVSLSPLLNHSPFSLENGPLVIPANTVKTFSNKYTAPITASVFAVAPHMHLIGRSIKCYGVTPLNDTIPMINIPDWDFHWQGYYSFQKLQKVPVGTKLHAYAVYDNTENNPHQPSFPPQNVALGEATTDEMMLVYFVYTPYMAGDENIILDSTLLASGASELPRRTFTQSVKVLPNPIKDIAEIQFDLPAPDAVNMVIADGSGKVVREFPSKNDLPAGTHDQRIDMIGLPAGNYTLQLKNKSGEVKVVNLVKM